MHGPAVKNACQPAVESNGAGGNYVDSCPEGRIGDGIGGLQVAALPFFGDGRPARFHEPARPTRPARRRPTRSGGSDQAASFRERATSARARSSAAWSFSRADAASISRPGIVTVTWAPSSSVQLHRFGRGALTVSSRTAARPASPRATFPASSIGRPGSATLAQMAFGLTFVRKYANNGEGGKDASNSGGLLPG